MKKIVCMFMALAILLTVAPVNIYAEEDVTDFSDVGENDYFAEAAEALAEAGILAGYPDGTFGAEKSITRAEMAAVICRMLDKEAESEEAAGETEFDDVAADHWASGYVNVASAEGIINGDGNGKFRPADDVKYEEAVKMVVCALGYGDEVETNAEDWSEGYLSLAEEMGILSDLKGTKGEPSTRGDIAVLSFAGIQAAAAEDAAVDGTPVASVGEGTYTSAQKVTLTTAVEGADIHYTTNGKMPTAKSKKYTKEITISKTTTLSAIAVKDGEAVGDVMTVVYTINIPASGGGSRHYSQAITSAQIYVGTAPASVVNAGDTLTVVTNQTNATGTVVWTVGGAAVEAAGNTYTVTALDMGKTIKAKFTGNGSYSGVATAECTVASKTQVTAQDIMDGNADSSPVALTDAVNTVFKDDEGNIVTVDASSTLTLSIEKPETTTEEISQATTLVVQEIINNSSATAEDLADVTAIAVDVNLSIDETAVHPVGEVTVTLSAQQLGLPEGTDLTNYTFSASHTNKDGDDEIVAGAPVTINNVQYIRFVLNGLSTIWIGNVPPRTVSFYNTEEDADSKVNSIGSVVVKFGDLTPTRQIPSPSRSGYLFCGWNYDMTRTPIISNLEVHALWVKGNKMDENSISAELSEDTDAMSVEIADGLVSVVCEEPANVPANLDVKVTVTAPEGAVKYYAGTDAAVVAAFNDEEGYITTDGEISFEANVSDGSGVVIPFAATYYYKWVGEEGEVISLEEIKTQIADGADTATSMEYTANVDRGIGTFEAYLVDSNDASRDYVAYINNYLSGTATEGYTLRNNASFDGYRVANDLSEYDVLKLVFVPFEGASFNNTDTVVLSGEYYDGERWNENWTGSYEIKDGKLIVTYPFATVRDVNDYADVIISVNDVEQLVEINWYGNRRYNEEPEYIECETWAEVITALQGVTQTKEYYINCEQSSAITLTGSLQIPANVRISLNNASEFTVARGATLTMTDDRVNNCASDLYICEGNLTVEDGGTVKSVFVNDDNGSRYYPSIDANNVTFKSGSKLEITSDSLIMFDCISYGEVENGVFTFEAGSTVNSNGDLDIADFDVLNINGSINSSSYTYLYCDEINVNGTVNNNVNGYGYFELYGTSTVGQNGVITVNNTSTSNRTYKNLEIYGPLTNKGVIDIKGNGAKAVLMNNGFVNYNEGTISVAEGCIIETSGTKYINTGVIKGNGVMYASLGDDYTNYDDGTEYVNIDDDGYWDSELGEYVYAITDYSRYKYTHDPAETVDTILYISEVINMGEGQCTLTIDAEAFPQN